MSIERYLAERLTVSRTSVVEAEPLVAGPAARRPTARATYRRVLDVTRAAEPVGPEQAMFEHLDSLEKHLGGHT